jgi:Rrf2 family iron-sulfur cluster assembly transcriptional regulator
MAVFAHFRLNCSDWRAAVNTRNDFLSPRAQEMRRGGESAPTALFAHQKTKGITIMRLSTKGRYAVTAMLDLALNSGKGPVTLADISVNQGISLSYLEQLFAALRAKQLVRGVRGPGGGYYLGKASDEISIADIICAVDEWVEFTRCGGRENCRDGKRCLTHTLWDQLSDEIFSFLSDISLADLVRRGSRDNADIDTEGLGIQAKKRAA